eukprot:7135364-Lingulodinium_polyedra.AAC.1
MNSPPRHKRSTKKASVKLLPPPAIQWATTVSASNRPPGSVMVSAVNGSFNGSSCSCKEGQVDQQE